MSSELEQLAASIRQIGTAAGPLMKTVRHTRKRSGNMASNMPRTPDQARAAAIAFAAAHEACKRAEGSLESFSRGCSDFAVQLAGRT